jgi:hypothetical protein
VWAGETVPRAYRFVSTLPATDIIASVPQNAGARIFRGDAGLAYHNYLMALHKHRSVNGQSSWQPPPTQLADHALRALPDPASRRILQSLGVSHLLVHGADLEPERRSLIAWLSADNQHYERLFADHDDAVFELKATGDPTLRLLETPQLPPGARLIPALAANASQHAERAGRALDGDPRTAWSSTRLQTPGEFFELALESPQAIVAFELYNPFNPVHVPLSFELSVAQGASELRRVFAQTELRVYRDLVYSPKDLVVRVVLPAPQLADRVRLTLLEAAPGVPLTIHEARLYAAAP